MTLTSQAKQTVLTILGYLNNLLSITTDAYCKMVKPKAYNNTLKGYLSGILDYAKVKVFHPAMIWANYKHYLY